ncbi:MAG: VWA domain-containing protein [Reinekea sp.]|jgi:Ca-activated chloride channel homolog
MNRSLWVANALLLAVLSACSPESSDSNQSAATGSTTSGSSTSENTTSGGSDSAPGSTENSSGGGAESPSANDGSNTNGTSTDVIIPSPMPVPSEPTQPANWFYFSYDDSGSSAARDLTLFSLENGIRPRVEYGRAYEFLNAETFEHFDPMQYGPFDLSFGMQEETDLVAESATYTLGVNLSGPVMTQEERPNVVLTILQDISGSMNSRYAIEVRQDVKTLLDVSQYGLTQLKDSLKTGDVINLVTFDSSAQIELEAFAVVRNADGLDNEHLYQEAVDNLSVSGSTNLDEGIRLAYQVAQRNYDAEKANRVVILTDAYANTGEVNANIIAQNTTINSSEGIYFAGIGIGSMFQDAFLNELTDIGKGPYMAMITPEDAQNIFGTGFMRFIDSAVADVRFKLEFPASLSHDGSAAEEVSENAEDVQTINFSYNDSQLFLEHFLGSDVLNASDTFTLTIEYKDDQGVAQSIEVKKTVAEMLGKGSDTISTATAVVTLADLVSQKTDCATVLDGPVFAETNEELVPSRLSDYRGYIKQFCNMKPGEIVYPDQPF